MLPARRFLLPILACFPGIAGADGWFVAEAPAALALSDAQEGVFRPGAMPAIGAYADGGGWLALGARLRAGALRNGPSPGNGLADPSYGGLVTTGLAMRAQAKGAWVELVGGGGITGADLVPVVEAGAGYTFPVGDYDIGPSARVVRVISRDEMSAFGTADLAVVGFDVRWGRARTARVPRRVPVERVVAAAAPAPAVVAIDRDHDRVFEIREASCAQRMDGCPLSEHVVMFEDRIVLDERVLFDFAKARVRRAGRGVIAEIAKMWRAHPEWTRITIEGHTDVRGSDAYNQDLSERRAARARRVLVELGGGAARIDAAGFGRSRPLVEASDETDHHKNRRVEFVIERAQPEVTP